jgi:hypothetical protein
MLMIGYKLFRKRKDGTYGTLFINTKLRMIKGVVYQEEDHPTKGFAHRMGWHILPRQESNRLAVKTHWCNRVWCTVEFEYKDTIYKPESQGGMVYIGSTIKILEEC